jgi:hypothetical protein
MTARIDALGQRAAARLAAAMADRLRETSGIDVEAFDGRVEIRGRALWRVPELRWIGGLLR